MMIFNVLHQLMAAFTPAPAMAETITVGDRDRRLQVRLDPNLPDDAYQQLFQLDLSTTPAGVLAWDRSAHGWRSV